MKKIRLFITGLFMAAFASTTFAQISPVDFMRNNPRAVFANPATYTVDNGYFDLGFGGINFSLLNIGLKYDNFFDFDQQGYPVSINVNKALEGFYDQNYLNTNFNMDLFHCGRRTRYGYFTFTHRLRMMESFGYTDDLIQLIAHGNQAFLGEENAANIDFKLAANLMQEFAAGYQMSLMDKLNVGLRFKFLIGFADLRTESLNMKLVTDPNSYALSLQAQAGITATLPYPLMLSDQSQLGIKFADSRFDLSSLFRHCGIGVDLGAEYQITDQIGVAAAINDLGYINWKGKDSTYYSVRFTAGLQDGGQYYNNGSVVFSGVTSAAIDSLMNGNGSGYVSSLMDTLKNYVSTSLDLIPGCRTGLNTNMMLRVYYDMTPEHRFSAQLTGFNTGFGMIPALTLAYTGSFNDKYDVVATYSMMKGSYDNLGIGLSANFGGVLLYLASNNIVGFFDPGNSSQLNIQFGISFTSGKTVSRSEMIVIKDKAAEQAADEAEEEAGEEAEEEEEAAQQE